MNVPIILAHPNPHSFCHAIATAAAAALATARHHAALHDLHEQRFDPLLAADELATRRSTDALVEAHCKELAAADGLIIVHPNWWSQPPAILKGWLDRVVRPGVAYDFARDDAGRTVPVGLLKARTVVVFTTAAAPHEREIALAGDPLDALWRKCVFGPCGVHDVRRIPIGGMAAASAAQRAAWLEDVAHVIEAAFPAA